MPRLHQQHPRTEPHHMPRRPILGHRRRSSLRPHGATACNGSPEAGQPNTAPPRPTNVDIQPDRAVHPVGTAGRTAEQAAITAAKKRATQWHRAAIDTALNNPPAANQAKLCKAGNGGNVADHGAGGSVSPHSRSAAGTGSARSRSSRFPVVIGQDLETEQPEVQLSACLTTLCGLTPLPQADSKPVSVGPGTDGRKQGQGKRGLRTSATGSPKRWWFLVDQQELGTC